MLSGNISDAPYHPNPTVTTLDQAGIITPVLPGLAQLSSTPAHLRPAPLCLLQAVAAR